MEIGFLQETKSILKSLVLSSPNGMTIDRLNRDYREMVGSWIPYNKLGFASLELFLKSIQDTLVVTGHGREARVGFVSNAKVKHLDEMVSRQKNTTRERKAAVLHGSSQNSSANRTHQGHNTNAYNIKSTPGNTTFCTFNRQPLINSNYFYAAPQGINVGQPYLIHQPPLYAVTPSVYHIPFENVQRRYFLPKSKMNYNQKPEYVPAKGDNVNKRANEQDKPKVIEDEQRSQKNTLETTNKSATSALDPSTKSQHRMLSEPHSSKQVLTERNSPPTMSSQQEDCNNSKSALDLQKNLEEEKAEIKFPYAVKHVDQENSSKDLSDGKDRSKNVLVNLNNSKGAFDKRNDIKNNNSSLNNQVNPTRVLSQKGVTDEIKYPNRNKKTAVNPVDMNISSGNESSDTLVNRSGFSSFRESKNSSLNNTCVLKAHEDPFAQLSSSDNDIDEAVPEFAANNLVFRVDYPENTVAFGKKIPPYVMPKELARGSVVGLFISEIHSPFKFWFHIYKDNHELDILMNRIECFYRRLFDDDLVIPKACLAPGQVCAALYNNMWHRAEILTNECKNKVKVHFVDYGTVSEIEIKNVKYLPIIFANTPMQAIRGSLSHIKPVSPIWPKRAIREFLSMVSEVLLYAQIIEVDEKEKTVYMVLCDTNNGETVQINKQLVDRGFAKLDNEWDENKIAKNGYRKRHPREIFPTFEMLETGEYPSLFELEQLLAQGIDYEKITEKIILSNLNSNLSDELVLREDCPTRKDTFSFNLLDTNPFKSDIISEIMSLKIFGD